MSTPDAGIAELRERVLAASAGGTPLRLKGAGTKDFYGEALEGDVLELRSHRGIVELRALGTRDPRARGHAAVANRSGARR